MNLGFLSKLVKPAIKGISRNVPKLVKGLKRNAPKLVRGFKSRATQLYKRGRDFFGFKPKPKPTTTAKVFRPQQSNVKIAGKFDETIPMGFKPIKDIPRTGIPKRTLTKAQRLKQAKIGIKNRGMKF